MNTSPECTSDKAFTLIELLAVIAVIGILAAIIIPTVSHVRNSARTAKCLSNTRQIGIAILMYASDHKNQLPSQATASVARGPSGPSSDGWAGKVGQYLGGNYAVFACGAYSPKAGDKEPTDDRLYNGLISGEGGKKTAYLSQSANPAQDALMVEQNTTPNGASTVIDSPVPFSSEAYWLPHAGKGGILNPASPNNVLRSTLYVDGHVGLTDKDGILGPNWNWMK